MKVTVWREKLPDGLGPPVAYLGDEHPTQGNWHQSAKHDFQPDTYKPLHMMGREFLIYSMYHATDPFFVGMAIENFGAACTKLGYKLPLKETDAVWLTYEGKEIDPASPTQNRWMLKNIAKVFGPTAAKEQAKAIDFEWPRETTSEQLAEVMKKEIIEDAKVGRVPVDIQQFSQLHDYVDASSYGGTDALREEWDSAAPEADEGHQAALTKLADISNAAQEIINHWLSAGGLRVAASSWVGRTGQRHDNSHGR